MNINNRNKKVFVGLSGGVDSSVAVALLKKQGFEVTGVFIKVWEPNSENGVCTWREDRLDAMRVCAQLDISFMTMDLEKEYKEKIVDYMIQEYKMGRTPNPDVMCNKYIKFGVFFEKAIEMGADFVATGHYSRIVESGKHNFSLLKGVDGNKDQSYFLWTLKQKQLRKILFPIGGYEKPKVRELAKKFGLPTAQKKDSQGLCFIGKIDMKEFLKEFIQEKRGDILNDDGEIIGYHDGVYFYTLGQRHGFVITKKSTNDMPYFVSSKDFDKNTITVSVKEKNGELAQSIKEVKLRDVNWISGKDPDMSKTYTARVRYRQPVQSCTIVVDNLDKVKIVFEVPQIATPGQSVVLYEDEICLGGGVIL